MMCFSAIVVGSGLAGKAAAVRLAARGHGVALVARSSSRHRQIGEVLSPEGHHALGRLGLSSHLSGDGHLCLYAIRDSWGSPNVLETNFVFNPHGPAWALDRSAFDRMLCETARQAGVCLLHDCRVADVYREGTRWRLLLKGAEKPFAIEAQVLVDATGRSSAIARRAGARRRNYDHTVALLGIGRPRAGAEPPEPILHVEPMQEGWCYAVPLPNGCMCFCHLTDSDLLRESGRTELAAWLAGISRTKYVAELAAQCVLPRRVWARDARTSCLSHCSDRDWVAVGDAACSYDPLSGEGLRQALESALVAADAVDAYLAGSEGSLQAFGQRAKESFAQHLRLRADYYRREQRWSGSLFWRRRHARAAVMRL